MYVNDLNVVCWTPSGCFLLNQLKLFVKKKFFENFLSSLAFKPLRSPFILTYEKWSFSFSWECISVSMKSIKEEDYGSILSYFSHNKSLYPNLFLVFSHDVFFESEWRLTQIYVW